MGQRSLSGQYTPVNPSKYRGDPTRIFWRSTWERAFMRKLDLNPSILWWQSEELWIPYMSPKDRRRHRYFPDFAFEARTTDSRNVIYLIEIKPRAQTQPPVAKDRKTPRYLKEVLDYSVNAAKWDAAQHFCARRGWVFKVLTEKELFGRSKV
jgi:hypothetical protein